jgi:hypothetical protein
MDDIGKILLGGLLIGAAIFVAFWLDLPGAWPLLAIIPLVFGVAVGLAGLVENHVRHTGGRR